jgi:hypothetical protein
MADSHYLSGLKNDRAECLGELQDAQAAVLYYTDLLAALDKILKHNDPDIRLSEIKPVRPGQPGRPRKVSDGEAEPRTPRKREAKADSFSHTINSFSHTINEIFRDATGPMFVHEIKHELSLKRPEMTREHIKNAVKHFLKTRIPSGFLDVHELAGGPAYSVVKSPEPIEAAGPVRRGTEASPAANEQAAGSRAVEPDQRTGQRSNIKRDITPSPSCRELPWFDDLGLLEVALRELDCVPSAQRRLVR